MSSSSRPLLSLVNASAEWQAGLPPRCRASVRLLDRVHVSVRQGDCIVVHHRDPSSATVLLAALRGHGALAAGAHLTGERHVGAGVRIRRCRISLDTMQAVQEGWRSAPREAAASPGRPVVYLLRATRRPPGCTTGACSTCHGGNDGSVGAASRQRARGRSPGRAGRVACGAAGWPYCPS